MRLILFIVGLVFSFGVQAQELKPLLVKAYLSETEKTADSLFNEARDLVHNDTTEALFHYFKFFYHDAWDHSDSLNESFEKASEKLAKIHNWFLYFDLIKNQVNIYNREAKFDQSVLTLKKGISVARKNRELKYQAALWSQLAYVYHDFADYRSGIEAGKSSLKLSTIVNDSLYIGEALNIIAISFDDWNKPDSALYYHFLNVDMGAKVLGEVAMASTYNNIGNTYLKLGELDSSEKYIQLALKFDTIQRDVSLMATVLNNLADIYLQKKEFTKARLVLDSALFFAEQTLVLEQKRDVYNTLFRYYEAIGDMSNAFHFQKKYHLYKDSMLNLDRLKVLNRLELKAATAEKVKEIANVELAVKKRNLLIVGLAGLLVFAFAIVRQLVNKRQKIAQESKMAIQEERLRISRDLHDNIGAELTLISSEINQQMYTSNDSEQRHSLEILSRSSRSAMSQLRETLWAINYESVTLEQFVNKIHQLGVDYGNSLGNVLEVRFEGENYSLKPIQVLNLFRVCKEGLVNAIKHASCNQITVRVIGFNQRVCVHISDNGVGFEQSEIIQGYGLQNMKQRIEELNGSFLINAEPQQGTKIEINIPI